MTWSGYQQFTLCISTFFIKMSENCHRSGMILIVKTFYFLHRHPPFLMTISSPSRWCTAVLHRSLHGAFGLSHRGAMADGPWRIHTFQISHFTTLQTHYTLWTPHSLQTLHYMDSTLHTAHSTLCTPRSTLCALHFTLDTLRTLHFTLHPSHFTYKRESFLSRKGIALAILRIPASQSEKIGLLN